jgi:nucleotide-binding universal stress UspA family protein
MMQLFKPLSAQFHSAVPSVVGAFTPQRVPNLEEIQSLLDHKGSRFCAEFGTSDRKVEWRSALDYPTDAVIREARAADLVIIAGSQEQKDPFRALDSAGTVLKAGRPVLVAPKGCASLALRRAAIAWKDVREARRADAVPLLQQAQSVVIVEMLNGGEEDGATQRLKDVATFSRHGVKTITQQARPTDASAADSLLRMIEEENIDLVVAGAYGHSRLGEWAFGGMTHDLFRQSPVCCLFAH